MAVRLSAPSADSLHPVPGVRLGIARAGIRKPNRKDLLLVAFDEGTAVAGVFTRNRFCAAPVHVCREHLAGTSAIRALLINTGNANAGTGASGMADARTMCAESARLLGVEAAHVLPFSTGVIMERLPIDRVVAGIPACMADLSATNWLSAAEAIMTTDTLPKASSRTVVIDGDGITDLDEYRADTNPFSANSRFAVTDFHYDSNTGNIDLDWTGSTRRSFTIWCSSDLQNWTQVGSAQTGSSAALTLGTGSASHLFFRLKADVPLTPGGGNPGI